MGNTEILKEIEKLNNLAFKLSNTNKEKALNYLFKAQQLSLNLEV